jgi:anti-anti-sigma factor
MNISARSIGDVYALDIEGKLDTQTSVPALEELMVHLDGSPSKVLIGLASLEFVSSTGLRVILRVSKHVSAYGGDLKVSGAQGMVKEVLETSGFDSLLDLYENEERAVSSF